MSTSLQTIERAEHLERLVELVVTTVRSPITKKDYARELRAFFAWYDGAAWLHVEGFSRATVIAYRDEMQRAGRGVVSINKALSAIRSFASVASDNGFMDDATAARVLKVKGLERTTTRLGTWLSLDELKRLVGSIPPTTPNRGLRDRAALLLLGACGMRREEAAALKFGQIQRRDGRWVLLDVLGKGNKVRTIPLHDAAKLAIDAWVTAAGITDQDAPLLPTIHNPDRVTTTPATGARLYDACRRYCAATGIEFRPHDLRRTFAVLAKRGGADYEEIRQALGHASITTTEVYLRAPLSLEKAASDKIEL